MGILGGGVLGWPVPCVCGWIIKPLTLLLFAMQRYSDEFDARPKPLSHHGWVNRTDIIVSFSNVGPPKEDIFLTTIYGLSLQTY